MTDTIHCFYLDLGWTEHAELVPFWEERWQREGWKTRVLGLADAEADPRFERMAEKAEVLPSVNNRAYEMANYIRWLAFSHVDGAVADYDVFPIKPFPPQSFSGFIHGDPTGGPGFIVGDEKDFDGIADEIMNYEPRPQDVTLGRPHVSDMIVLRSNPKRFGQCLGIVRGHIDPGWQRGPLVHFTNDSMVRFPGSKKANIERILNDLYPLQAIDQMGNH